MAIPAQGQTYKVGSFTKSTGSAPVNQAVPHGLGKTPKGIILWTLGKTDETMSASYLYGIGFTDGSTSYSSAIASQDNSGTSNASRRMANKALTIVQWGEATVAEADLYSWDSTNFTLRWTTNNTTAYVIHYLVLSGNVSAKVVNWQAPNGTGSKTVSGIGFQPDVVISAYNGDSYVTVGQNISGAGHGLGVMDKAGNQWATYTLSQDASSRSDTQRGQQTNATIYSFDNGLYVRKRANFSSMNADGFTVNFTVSNSNLSQVCSLALRGLDVKAGNFTKSTGTAPINQGITGMGFMPDAVLLASFQDIARTNPVAQARFGFGAGDGTTQGSSAFTDTNNQGTTSVHANDKTSKVFMKVNNNTPAIDAEANLYSTDMDGFTLRWTTNDTVQTQILYLGLADIVHRFGYMKPITIDRTKVALPGTVTTALTNFPLLISCADPNLRSTTYGGHVTSASGYDIVFRSRDDAICGGAGTAPCQLDHEIEAYDQTNGKLTAWVRIPSLNTNAASSNTIIWVYYGNPDITTSLANPGGVWDGNFVGVWHLSDNAANTTVAESSAGNTGTAAANTSSRTAGGQIASALTFNGTSDYVYTTTQFTNVGGTSFTVSAWVDTTYATGHKIIGFEGARTGTGSTTYDRMLYVGTDGKIYGATIRRRHPGQQRQRGRRLRKHLRILAPRQLQARRLDAGVRWLVSRDH
jgi:hypothetical protein